MTVITLVITIIATIIIIMTTMIVNVTNLDDELVSVLLLFRV